MANRVTGIEVKEIIKTSLSASAVEVFITPANLIVTKNLASLGTVDSDTLKEIERWLSAHFLASSNFERQKTQEKIGDASANYGGQFGLKLDFTQYGQMVKTLDNSGVLSKLGNTPARVNVIFDPEGTS